MLIVSGSDAFHDWRKTTPQLRALLESSGRFDVRVVEDTEALASNALTNRYKVIVLNGQAAASTPNLRRNLARYVRNGGGLVAFHWAVDSFHDWPGYRAVLGRTWQEGTSIEEHGRFEVQVVSQDHPITRGLAPWVSPDGEAIHFRLSGTAPVDVLATTRSQKTGELAPVIIVHRYGKGRVFFSPFGHSATTRADPGFEVMALRAVAWCASGIAPVDLIAPDAASPR